MATTLLQLKDAIVDWLDSVTPANTPIDWEDGELKSARILSSLGNKCIIRYGDKVISFKTKKGESFSLNKLLEKI